MADTSVKIGERRYDLRNAFPMTLGDWEWFNQHGIMEGENLSINKPTHVIDMFHHLLQKCDSTITREQVTSLPMTSLNGLLATIQELMEVEKKQLSNPTLDNSLST